MDESISKIIYSILRTKSTTKHPEQHGACRRAKDLELQLLEMNTEKDKMQAEYDKMPTHGGRTISQRKRKMELEQGLAVVEKDISAVRLELKKLGLK